MWEKKPIDQSIKECAKELVSQLNELHLKIATAESFTGGMLASAICSVPGASNVFECGIIAYSERIKTSVLGVDPKTIEKYGVVSTEVAAEMAHGVKRVSGADLCVSTTGYAGPGGGTEKCPVGTCAYGFYSKVDTNYDIKNIELALQLDGVEHPTREMIQKYAIYDILTGFWYYISEEGMDSFRD